MNRGVLMSAMALLAGVSTATPAVTSVTVSQDAGSRVVKVGYALSEAAIVTFEAYTNGVSVGDAPLRTAYGDVWRKVTAGSGKAICWQPRTTFPHCVVDDGSLTVKVRAWALDNPPDYMIVDLAMPSNVWWYASTGQFPYDVHSDLYKSAALVMRRIRAAGIQWQMGSLDGEWPGHAEEEVSHPVILTNDFYMAIYKTTARQHKRLQATVDNATWGMTPMVGQGATGLKDLGTCYESVRGAKPTYDWPTTGHSVDPNSICGKIRALTGIETFDLPTDAEWEFAMRAGTTDAMCGATNLSDIAWWKESSGGVAHVVGLLMPNGLGIYDPLGNGFELCLDYYSTGDTYAKKGVLQVAPVGAASHADNGRIVRSASWKHDVEFVRAAPRSSVGATQETRPEAGVGYRLVCGCDFR